MRLCLAIVLSFFLSIVLVEQAAGAECAKCDALGLTSQFTYNGASWVYAGAVDLCAREPNICKPIEPVQVVATDELINQLEIATRIVNFAVSPRDDTVNYDKSEFWTFPANGYGDCEDYVLAKRAWLIEKGIPAGALRMITLEIKKTGEDHAILGVVTDRGVYLLDNLNNDVRTVFSPSGYVYKAEQMPNAFDHFQMINGVRM